jgi:hypothetical protein
MATLVRYGIIVIADSRNNIQLTALNNVCTAIDSRLVAGTVDPSGWVLNGETLQVPSPRGTDTAEIEIHAKAYVLFTASGPTRDRIMNQSPPPIRGIEYYFPTNGSIPDRATAEAFAIEEMRNNGYRKYWIVDHLTTLPLPATLEPSFITLG